jgi:hypothetical protein
MATPKRMKRTPEFVKRWAARRSKGQMSDTGGSLSRHDRPPDTVNPRAKGQRKGKVAADRWNQ